MKGEKSKDGYLVCLVAEEMDLFKRFVLNVI